MNLYLQLLSQSQLKDVVQLLLVPSRLQSDSSGCVLDVSAGGKVRTQKFETIERAIDKLRLSKFNQVQVAYDVAQGNTFGLGQRVESITGLFTPSPTCELWFESNTWPAGGERAIRTRKMNARAQEVALRHYNIRMKPSILEVVIVIDSSERPEKILDAFAESLAKLIPKSLDTLNVFGCVDAGGPEYFVKLESNVLMTEGIRIMAKLLPTSYPELGQRFDAVHPVMFGLKRVCSGIAMALGKSSRLIPSNELNGFAVLRVTGNEREAVSAGRRISDWMLPSASEPTGVSSKDGEE